MVEHNGTDDGTWQYQMKCSNIPIELIIGITVGSFFGLCLALVISAIVIININDWRQYQNYLKNKQFAESAFNENINPLFANPMQKTENPAYQKSD